MSTSTGPYLMGIDYGTESCRVAIFDMQGRPVTFAATAYKTSHPRPGSLAFLIGPEGGLADSEVSQAQAAGFLGARLGPRVLRTETAPVVALSVAQQLWGDF